MKLTKGKIQKMALRGEDITQLDVSHLTNMSGLFCDVDVDNEGYENSLKDFNQDISGWDVSNVTDMSNMFYGCSSFNQDLSSWNVSQVKNMSCMFAFCSSFNQDISSWDAVS